MRISEIAQTLIRTLHLNEASNSLKQEYVSFIRQKATLFFGPDSTVYIGDNAIMIDCPRPLPDKMAAEIRLIDIFRQHEDLRRFRLILVDPRVAVTPEMRRFRVIARRI